MSSAEANWRDLAVSNPPSAFVEHDASCCRLALRWLTAQDAARTRHDAEPPAWIPELWEWGPQAWPLSLCQAVGCERLDCGGLAALAHLVWSARVPDVVGVQAVLRYTVEDVGHWQAVWARHGSRARWCTGQLAYHELVGLSGSTGALRLWDPTDGHPLTASSGYSQPVALKLTGSRALRFGNDALPPGVWQPIGTMPPKTIDMP
jgi:hypothetical protein